jgi:hypothetical protein
MQGLTIQAKAGAASRDDWRPRKRPGIREFSVGEEMVLVPPRTGDGDEDGSVARQALTLNSSGRAIWELCDGNRSVDDITDALAARFSVDRGGLAHQVVDTVTGFLERGVILEERGQRPLAAPTTTFVIGVEDKPFFCWQVALFLESFRSKLPPGWQTLVVVCNNGEPISDEMKHVLASYETKFAQATNHLKNHPLDVGSEVDSHYSALNRIEALAAASCHVGDGEMICLLDSDTFLYRELSLDLMPSRCAAPWNWHVDRTPFFSSDSVNEGGGVDLHLLLEAIGCRAEFKPGGVNIFVTGAVAKNKKFIADCFRFAQVLFLLGRIAGMRKTWTAEMPSFALAMTANGISYDLLHDQEFLVSRCDERSISPGTIYHYYSDPADFGRTAFYGSKWYKQLFRRRNFLRSDFRSYSADAAREDATDHEKYFFELAENARRRLYLHKTPERLIQWQLKDRAKIPLLGLGFHKTTIDRSLHEVLLRHLRSNIHKFKSEPANAFLQTESATAYPSLLYHDEEFNQQLLRDLQGMHERWSGLSLKQAACYGIRVYQPGSYLYNHTDRPTHVVSSTICVDHRLTNRWPLYIEDLDGRAHEVPVEPGEIVFFEGARLQHGRPYALEGEYYATIFIHYTPTNLSAAPSGARRS